MVLTSITDPPESSLPAPSSKGNDFANKNTINNALPKRPKSRVVPSRYLSPSPSNPNSNSMHSMSNSGRSGSPLRSQSTGRRRPATPQADMSAAAKLVITSSRSLSVSFQGEAFPLHVSKAKPVSGNSENNNVKSRKATPERRRVVVRDQGENSRPVDQHLWPGRTRRESDSSSSGLKDKRNENSLFRSLDWSYGLSDGKKLVGLGSGKSNVVKALQQSMIMDSNSNSSSSSSRRASFDGRLSLDLGNVGLLKRDAKNSGRSMSVNDSSVGGDVSGSETDSVSSGGNSGRQELGLGGVGSLKSKSGPRGIIASARFWQETNSRLRRLQDPGSPLTPNPASGSKFSQPRRLSTDSPMSSSRTVASPMRGASSRPASPNRQWNSPGISPSRGMSSPSRVRPNSGSVSSISSAAASILSFSVGIRRGKVGEDHIFDAHTLRLLYNHYLQWRFINARAESTFEVQRIVAEKYLWNAWVTVSELRHSVTLRRMKLLLLRQKLKSASILKGQMTFLEEWSILDRDHSSSLHGAIEALKASTFRLPLVGKATADIQNLKNAIGSALDVMQAMASSICWLSSKVDTDIHASVDEMNTLVSELVSVTAKEQLLLDQCRSSMSELAVMQVKDYSLRTHVLQSNRIQTTQILTTHV